MATRSKADAGMAAVERAAAEWIVRLSSDDPVEREAARSGYEAWRRADQANALAAERLESFVARTRQLGSGGWGNELAGNKSLATAARAALHEVAGQPSAPGAAGRSARRLGAIATVVLMLALPLLAAVQFYPPAYLFADLGTARGEQRSELLGDGTRLTLSTATALDYSLEAAQRRVHLIRGAIHVDVGRDPGRPFVVDTAHGRIEALGTRFIVRHASDSVTLVMLESETRIVIRYRTGPGIPGLDQGVRVGAGQSVRFGGGRLEWLPDVDVGTVETAFLGRRLAVQDRPLGEVLDELVLHRPGLIRYRPADVAGIRVSAVLPLDDTDRALALLEAGLPQIRVDAPVPWYVRVDARD